MSDSASAHVAAISINQTVGDWRGNRDRVIAALNEARRRGAQLAVLPEMCLSGYSLGDRLLRRGTLDRSWKVLRELLPHTQGIIACVGLPILHRGVIYNGIAVLANGRLVGAAAKENLATGDVQYENRWFQPWPHGRVETLHPPGLDPVPLGTLVFEAEGMGRFALEVCEDGWKGIRPGSIYALAGAEILLNPSASWFVMGKHLKRRRLVEQVSQEDHCAYLYTSLLGCDSTRLVFDGSVFIAENGAMVREGRRFVFNEDFEVVDCSIDLDSLRLSRMEEGSWREQVGAFQRGEYGASPQVVRIPGPWGEHETARSGPLWWEQGAQPAPDPSLTWLEPLLGRKLTQDDLMHLELELALCMGLRDYAKKSRVRAFAVALSGGRDSAMVALLVQRMLRYEHPDLDPEALRALVNQRLVTAYMATDNSGPVTQHAAATLAAELGARHSEVNIQAAVDVHVQLGSQISGEALSWGTPAHDVPLQNVQARLRGSLIWMLANLNNALLLATSNKSEAAVGYTTMDGDTSGGLAPISDVPKSLIGIWLRWAQAFHGLESLQHVNVQQPTAELRPKEHAQTDEGDLMPFKVLDSLMQEFVQEGRDPVGLFHRLWPRFAPDYGGDPRAFAAHIHKFVRLFCQAQWKRERFAISFRVTGFDLDPKTGFRFPPVQAPFTEELEELEELVRGM